jgi:hypothetical protein
MNSTAREGMIKIEVFFSKNFLQCSKIATTNEERYFLYQLIKVRTFTDKIETKLLLRATDNNSWRAKDFHDSCDDKGPTIVLIKVKDTNKRCGGFTMVSWSSDD